MSRKDFGLVFALLAALAAMPLPVGADGLELLRAGSSPVAHGTGAADLSLTLSVVPEPALAGNAFTATITVTNAGPSDAAQAVLSIPLPAGTRFGAMVVPVGWSCAIPAPGETPTISCTALSFAPGSVTFPLTLGIDATVPGGSTISTTATVSSATPDGDPGNNAATAMTTISSPALLRAAKSASGNFLAGQTVTYSVLLTNPGPANQGDNPGPEMTDVLPAALALVSASATAGTAGVDLPSNTVTWNGNVPAGGTVTVIITATIKPGTLPGTVVVNQAQVAYDADGNGTNEAPGVSDDPAAAGTADPTAITVGGSAIAVPALDRQGLLLLGLLLAAAGGWVLRRR